jgi:Ca2+-binding RTX toxin-like protein
VHGFATPGAQIRVTGTQASGYSVVTADADGAWSVGYAVPTSIYTPGVAASEDLVADIVTGTGPYTHSGDYSQTFRVLYDPEKPVLVSMSADAVDGGVGIDSAGLQFSEPVYGLTLDNLALTRNGSVVDWVEDDQTIDGSDPAGWTVDGLADLTDTPGVYRLTVVDFDGVTDAAGNEVDDSYNQTTEFALVVGTSGADAINLSPSATTGRVDVSLGSTNVAGLLLGEFIAFGQGGNDVLTDPLAPALRPAWGTFFDGGSGTDSVAISVGDDSVYGTDSDDVITADGSAVTIDSPDEDAFAVVEFDAAELLSIDGGWGDDLIEIADDFAMSGGAPVSVYGGDGADTISGGRRNDLILGGEAAQSLTGERDPTGVVHLIPRVAK